MYIQTYTYGKVPIELWEIPAFLTMLVILYIIAGRIKRKNIKQLPEYKYFLYGLWAKVIGGIFFACIYVFYYGQGDTTSYYECSMSFCKLFYHDMDSFFKVYFGPGTQEMKSFFTAETGEPMMYMFGEGATRFVIKILVPFMLATGNSYFLTTILVAVVTYGALWKLYLVFTSYFPAYHKNLALGILFMPSVIFWGSGILKDSFTLAATCYLMVTTNDLIMKRGSFFWNLIKLVLFAWIVLSIKAYVLLILLPSSLVWIFYSRIKRIRNRLVRYMVVPFIYFTIIAGSYFAFIGLGESFGKFSIEKALQTAVVTQKDLKQDYYEGNSFDIGEFEPTPAGAMSKFPAATLAGLYRPTLLESKNIVMLISGLENLFIFGLTMIVLFSFRWRVMARLISGNPIILYSFMFSILFAFMIGITTSNFGALVRFKIPLIPLYMASIMVIYSELKKQRYAYPGKTQIKPRSFQKVSSRKPAATSL
jgi:hypothetical protein